MAPPKIVKELTKDNVHKCTKERLKEILKEIQTMDYSDFCPLWTCDTCKDLFPRVIVCSIKSTGCPCSVYNTDYLINRLRNLIRNFPEA